MAIQSIPEFTFPPLPDSVAGTPTYTGSTSFDITALNGYGAYVGQMPYDATLDTVFFRVGSIGAGNSFTARVAIEQVSLTSGFPTASLLYPGASASILVTAVGNYAVRFPDPITIPRGQLFSIVIAAIAGTPNTCRFAEFSDDNPSNGFPYMVDANAGTPALAADVAPGIGLALSGVSAVPIPHCWPMTAQPVQVQFRAPNSYGNKITIRTTMRASGAVVWGDTALSASIINLYGTDGATVLASTSAWNYSTPTTVTNYRYELLFPQPATLTPGTYYLAVSGNTAASNTTTMHYATFSQNIWREASPMGGKDMCYVTTAIVPINNNSWTEDSTRQMFLGLLIDGLDDGVDIGAGETSSVFFA